ncbi:MAG: hypothetical protein KKB59_19370 [Spirochaetes bacterium]|nr:hypothetical protein [Spirochaetota bacterium]
MQSGLRKIKKKDPILMSVYNTPPDLVGAIFCYGRIRCLDENTEIYTFDKKLRKIKIKDLSNNFKVLSHNFKKNKKEIKDAAKHYTGEKECYEIILENNKRVIATATHRFFTKNNKEICVKDLKSGDKIACFKAITGSIGMLKKDGYNNKGWYGNKFYIPWHKGKTKKDFPQLSRFGNKNYIGWCKGLTKETDKRLLKMSEKAKLRNRSDMLGNKNPAKRLDIRKKISKAVSGKNNGMYGKKHTKKTRLKMSKNSNRISHMLGKHHTKKAKEKMSIAMSGKNNPSYGIPRYPKVVFNKFLNHNIRSSWEQEVCIILKENDIDYLYEPRYFKVDNGHTYTPDIKINDNKYIEIKGPLFDFQVNKMNKFKIKYPYIKLICITNKSNFKKLLFCDLLINYEKFVKNRSVNEILKH